MESTNQGVAVDSHVEEILAVEVGEEFTTYDNPLVEQPPMDDTTFHFPMEGHVSLSNWVDSPSNDTKETEYGVNSPFWRISMVKQFMSLGLLYHPYLTLH